MKLRRLLIACLPLLILTAAVPSARGQAGAPAFEAQGAVSQSASAKHPRLAADGAAVHLAANSNRSDASYWSKQDTAPAFGAAGTLGPAEGQPDYSTASIAVGPGGALYYVWVNQPQHAIFLRSKPAGAAWGPARTVAGGQPFPVHPELAVTSDGAVFVVWRNPDQPFVYRRSADGGLTWGGVATLSEHAGVNAAALAAGPGGSLAVAYTGGEANRLQVYLAIWGGAGFTRARLSSLSGDYADPSLSFAPDGRLSAAWRGVAEAGGGAGVFYAERQADGSYPVARLVAGKVAGRVSLSADGGGNAHLLWTAAAGDGYQLWYAVRPVGGAWSQPVPAPPAGGLIFNAYGVGAIGTGGAGYAHVVSEVFVGTSASLRHYRFSAGLTGRPMLRARPLIEQGAALARGATLAVSFADVAGSPAQVRYSWGAPPTDAAPWWPFAELLAVEAPAMADPARCAEATLFTQVRTESVAQAQPLSDTITLDPAVQARVSVHHAGAAPGYTDEPAIDVLVEDAGECSGLASLRDLADGASPIALAGAPAQISLPLPDREGAHERSVELADRLGNTRVVTLGVLYDRTDPTADYPEPLEVAPQPRASVLQTLAVRGAAYSDGDGALPWAVAVAVSRAPIGPAGPPLSVIVPLKAGQVAWDRDPGVPGAAVSAEAMINLVDLLPRAQLTPGVYHYALALVDPAGNPTASVALGQLDLASVTYPTLYVPAVTR